MDEPARMHELLPWYVTGSLESGLAEGFRRHLAGCDACREELSMLEALRHELATHGADFLAEHPSPERVVGAVRGELAGPEAAEVRRHLALCRSCTEETSWISGEGAYGQVSGDAVRSSRPIPRWAWVAVAAVLLVSTVPWLYFAGSRGARSGVVPVHHLDVNRLGAAPANVFKLEQGQAELVLILQVDVARESFPLTVTLLDEEGATVHSESGIASLLDGYLHYRCARRDCPPGAYTLEIHGSDAATTLSFDFTVVP